MSSEFEPDLGFDYKDFFKRKKINPNIRTPRENASEVAFNGYKDVYRNIGDADFEVDAPHEMFALDPSDEKWVMADAVRGEMFDDHTRRLRIITSAGRYSIQNEEEGVRISGIFDSTSPQKSVLEVRPIRGGVEPRNMWLVNNAIRFASGQIRGHMDSIGRIAFERDNISYWNGFLGRAVAAHLGSLASERQSISAA